jgi:hypothetical protein
LEGLGCAGKLKFGFAWLPWLQLWRSKGGKKKKAPDFNFTCIMYNKKESFIYFLMADYTG